MRRLAVQLLVIAAAIGEPAAETEPASTADPASTTDPADEVVFTEMVTVNRPDGSSDVMPLPLKRGQDAAAATQVFMELIGLRDVDSALDLAGRVNKGASALSPPFEPPSELRLRTAGAHKRKAEELAKDGDHDLAAMHLLRALLRPGLDEAMIAQLKRQYQTALEKLVQQRQAEAVEAAELAAAEARRIAEAAALVEARARTERDEADWTAYMAVEAASGEAAHGERVLSLPINLKRGEVEETVELHVRAEQDASHAVYAFCSANGLHSAEEVQKLGAMVEQNLAGNPAANGAASVAATEHLELGTKQRRDGAHADAGVHFARALAHPDAAAQLSSEQMGQAQQGVVEMMRTEAVYRPFLDAARAQKWEVALSALEHIPREQRTAAPRIQLLEARCNQKLGKWGNVQRAAARVVEATASYSSWTRGQPRMLAVSLGASAALELGDGKKALGFLSSVLKYDPDQSEVRKQYKQLKEVLKLMEEAESQLVKGYNHKAVKALDDVLAKLRGMDVANSLFRAQVLLKLCRARSSMKKHEEAMDDCQTAYHALSEPGPGVHVSPIRVREALEARAAAHEHDKNYDDAVVDLRAALELAGGAGGGGEKAQELQEGLRRMQDLQRKWACVDPSDHKAWQDNRCGHPQMGDGGRDHKAVLELPANLDQLKREDQCGWVTKQYRKLARVWHPDRYKGLKVRAERKMRECAEAKEVLVKQLECGKEGRRGRD